MTMKIFNLLLTALFLVSAVLQLNDPDPVLWTILYLAIALICGFAAFGKYNRWVILVVMAGCIYELSTLMPAFIQWIRDGMPSITEEMKATTPYVELVREFLGVAISVIVLIFQYVRSRMHAMRKRVQASTESLSSH
jgi:hypothetical protein